MKHFKAMLRKADNTYVMDHSIPKEELDGLRPHMTPALEAVQATLEAEATGDRQGRGPCRADKDSHADSNPGGKER
eukprot:scaffold30407_cov41-Prasinocladus_malaysianus.AAC.1